MPTVEKHFFQKINTDLEQRYMQPGMYRYLLNGIVNSSSSNKKGAVENPLGTKYIQKLGGYSGGQTGWTESVSLKIYEDKETNTLLIFLYEPIPPYATEQERPKDSIWRFTPKEENFHKLIEWDGLNFEKENKITGIDVLNGNVIFTDNKNEIRKIHIQKAIDGEYNNSVLIFDFVNGVYEGGFVMFALDSSHGDVANQFPYGSIIDVIVTAGNQQSGAYTITSSVYFPSEGKTRLYTNGSFGGTGASGTISSIGSIKEEDVTLLRRAPRFPLDIEKTFDDNFDGNNLKSNSFQFTYRYIYWDNEYSTFAPMSKMALIDSRDDLVATKENNILCKIPDIEEVRHTVKEIEWCFRLNNTNEFSIFKITKGGTRIVDFRNDVAGVTLSEEEALKPFDDIPKIAKGLSAVQNRVFINNYVSGYDSSLIDISASIESSSEAQYTNETIYERRIDRTPFPIGGLTFTYTSYQRYWWLFNGRWFEATRRYYYGGSADYLVSPNQGDGLSDSEMQEYSFTDASLTTWKYYYPDEVSSGETVIFNQGDSGLFFKTGDTYQIGIKFNDFLGRNIGVLTNDAAKVVIPERTYPLNTFSNVNGIIKWTLGENSQIPLWATDYEIVRTRNLSRSFFLQGVAGVMKFGVETEKEDGTVEFKLNQTWSADAKLYFHVKNSIKYKIGYVFSKGDRFKFNLSGIWYDSKITKQQGSWIVCDNIIDSAISEVFNVFYEIYTPYLGSLDESYFGIGEKYAINDAGTSSRAYSKTSGLLSGDVTRKKRDIYEIDQNNDVYAPPGDIDIPLKAVPVQHSFEAMNPNDDYYEQWVSDIGKPTFIVKNSKSIRKKYTLKWGGEYFVDSSVNNIGSFSAFDEYNMPLENGPASFLGVTNNNLLYFHERNVSSVYIREGFLRAQAGEGSLIRTVETVGDDRKLKLGHGCINPESMVEHEDNAWYWDMHKGAAVKYTNQGLVPISNDGMVNHFYDLSRKLLPYKDEIKVYGAYDPYLRYYILTFEANTNANYAGETFAFSDNPGGGGVGWFSYKPVMYGTINKTLFSYQNGSLFSHTDENNCNFFYSAKYDRILRYISNQEGSKVKIWANFRIDAESVYSDMDSSDIVIRITNDQNQEGRVFAHQIEKREGVFIGALRQDVLSPNSSNLAFNGDEEKERYFMYNGDLLRSQVCEVEITNDRRDLSPLYFVSLLYRISEASFK